MLTTRSGWSSASDSEPGRFLVLARNEVDIAEVQDAERGPARGQDGQRFLTQDELVLFPQAVPEGGQPRRRPGPCGDGKAAPDCPGAAHQWSMSWAASLFVAVAITVAAVGSAGAPGLAGAGRERGLGGRCLPGVRGWRVCVRAPPFTMLLGGAGNGSVP